MVNSYLADTLSPDSLAQGMLVLGGNATLRRSLGAVGRDTVLAKYTPEAVTTNNARIIRCVVLDLCDTVVLSLLMLVLTAVGLNASQISARCCQCVVWVCVL